jgi:beta-glucosidase
MNRREVMVSGTALGSLLAAGRSSIAGAAGGTTLLKFPPGFLWGAATAAYQCEGAVHEDGRGPSIWDTFAHTPGKIRNGDTGDVACDSYHRWREDIALVRALNCKSYRFSIAWSRIQPTGRGPVNQKGLDYYSRLVDTLLEVGIRPFPTLYHWDLPQALDDTGGWLVRDTADRLADYAHIVASALGDRVRSFAVVNEPKTFTQVGYLEGTHAPGHRNPHEFLKATHVVNLANAAAYRAIKAVDARIDVGSVYDCGPCWPASDTPADQAAAVRWDKMINLWYLQTTLTGRYPELLPPDRQAALLGFLPGDEKLLRAELDFVGINYYTGWKVTHEAGGTGIPGLDLKPQWAFSPRATGKADNGWDIDPVGFYDILLRMQRVTGTIPIEITENGCADNTPAAADGRYHDPKRLEFFRTHLVQLHRAIQAGVPVRGYHAWSLMDNFEWAEGYSQRFGMVHVDFAQDQKRTVRDSGLWYAAVARDNAVSG